MSNTAASLVSSLRARPASRWWGDLTGGVTSAVVALPLALAFALASGAPPQAGLYTAIVAGIVGALAGGSAVQITGPTGAMAVVLVGLMSRYGLAQMLAAGVIAGAIQLTLGLTRVGRWIAYLPLPVITGFTAGIGVLIASGQVANLLGLAASVVPAGPLPARLAWEFTHLGLANPANVALAAVTVATMVLWPKLDQRVPGALVALVAATTAATLLRLPVPRIGAIPHGLPWPSMVGLRLADLPVLVRPAIAIAALGAVESLLSATVADRLVGGVRHDPDRELVGQGLANLVVPFFGGIPATGAIARTAVNIRAGGRSRASGVVHGLALAAVVLAMGPLAALVPLAALAGILLVVSLRMVEWPQIKVVAASTKADLLTLVATGFVTVAFDLVTAIEVGLVVAAGLFLRRMAQVRLISHPEVVTLEAGVDDALAPAIAVYDVDRPLFFGDAHRFEELLREDAGHRAVVVRLAGVPTMDVTAAMALDDALAELARRGVHVGLCGCTRGIRALLDRLGVVQRLGGRVYPDARAAVEALARELTAA